MSTQSKPKNKKFQKVKMNNKLTKMGIMKKLNKNKSNFSAHSLKYKFKK